MQELKKSYELSASSVAEKSQRRSDVRNICNAEKHKCCPGEDLEFVLKYKNKNFAFDFVICHYYWVFFVNTILSYLLYYIITRSRSLTKTWTIMIDHDMVSTNCSKSNLTCSSDWPSVCMSYLIYLWTVYIIICSWLYLSF